MTYVSQSLACFRVCVCVRVCVRVFSIQLNVVFDMSRKS